jgi:hypothetical protein
MALNVGTLVGGAIRPIDSLDLIATAYSNEIKGGIHSYEELESGVHTIIEPRREWGMLASVYDDGDKNGIYQLKYDHLNTNINDNGNWVRTTTDGKTSTEWVDSVKSILLSEPESPTLGDRYLLGTTTSDTPTGTQWSAIPIPSRVIVEYNSNNTWDIINPVNGMTVRVDSDNNAIYKYEGGFTSGGGGGGEWKLERVTNVFSIQPLSINGVTYSTTTSPTFNTYTNDLIFLAKFNIANSGSASLNINGIGYKQIKITTPGSSRSLLQGDIDATSIYSLSYNGTGDYFQLTKPFPTDAYNIKYIISAGETVTVKNNEQYWVYGDLTIEEGGSMINYGQLIIANGELILDGYYEGDEALLIDIFNTPILNDTSTIDFSSSLSVNGPSFSAAIKNNSITTNLLNTVGGVTSSYILSNNGAGSFQWVPNSFTEIQAGSVSYAPGGPTLTANTVQGALDDIDTSITDQNIIIVKLGATGPSQFSSIKAAVDSISTAANDNRYTVQVGPGDFYEDTITMQPYVNIVGHDRSTRIIAATTSQNIFIGSDYSTVMGCLVTGATDPGYAAFYHTSPTGDAQSAFVIKDCIFGSNYNQVICYADTNRTTVQVIDSRYGDAFSFTNGFIAYNNNNSTSARILLLHCYSQGMLITGPTIFAKASGENCEIVMNSVQANANTIVAGTVFLQIEKGAKCRLNAVNFTAWETGIYNKYYSLVGELPSTLIGVAISCQNSTNQIILEHPTTIGSLSGSFDTNTILTVSPNCSIVVQDTTSGDFTITGGLNIRYSPTVVTDISTLISQSSTMGIIYGGDLSTTSGLTLSVSAGYGYYHDNVFTGPGILNKLTWGTQSISIATSSTHYVYFDNNGDLTSDPTIPITSENILLGRVRTNATGFEFIERTPLKAEHWANNATKLFRKGLGAIYSNGSIVTENTTPFKLDVSQGTFYYGANEFEPTGGTGITFSSYYPNGSGGWIISTTNSVDNTYYAGTNSLIGLSASYFTKHSLYIIGDNGDEKYFMVYDTNQYANQFDAQNASLPTPPTYFSDAVALIAGIIIQQGTSSIVEIRDQRPVIGFRAAGINASADHSSLLNLNVDSHTQYLLTNGTRTLTGNLQMGSNSITGVNLINSVNISSHSSRHLPGSPDALATGTPSTIGVTNQIGSIAAFARQDHIHAHGNLDGGSLHALVTTTQSGFMSFGDKLILDNITSLTQSLTNKTITGSSSYVEANALKTSTDPVYIVADGPSVGQTLIAISATAATWQTIPTGTPSTIGTFSQIGSLSTFARQDHIHAHGNQIGGSLHALVTTTQSGFMSFGDKVILDNITSSTQSLTNKGITGSTNYVDANGLKTTTNPVYIVAAAPSSGQVLTAVSATQATWQTQNTSSQKIPADPATTSSLVGVMMGLSASITPVVSGKILIIISGDMDNDTGDDGAQVQMRTGTGTPPINGAALTGTTQGGLVKMSVVVSGGATAVTRVPFSLNAIQTGLTLNTPYWIDLSLAAIGAGNARVRDVSISVVEL